MKKHVTLTLYRLLNSSKKFSHLLVLGQYSNYIDNSYSVILSFYYI